ncbi:MAG: ATP-binding protein [Actinomycetota bacterium]
MPEPRAAGAGCALAACGQPDRRQPLVCAVIAAGFTSLMHLVVATGPLTVTATLPGTPASVSIARRLVREALPDCPRADDLMLAVTELTTNTVAHSASGQGGSFTVRLRTAPRWARIEVTDDGPAAGEPGQSNGWGLAIVSDITDRATTVIQPRGCRTAWCEVSWPA